MEFKITKDKIGRWNKILLFWNEIKQILTLSGFCCPFGLFHRFCGVLRCMSQLSIDGVKAGQSCFERPGPRGRFLAEIRIHCSISPSNAKKDSPFVPFYRRLEENVPPFRSNSNNFCFTTGAFIFRPHSVTVLSTTAQLEININDRSCMMTATYRTGAQSTEIFKV